MTERAGGDGQQVDGGLPIRVEGVSRSFHSGGGTVHAIRDVALDVPAGQFIALVGRSGSGKTTLLNLIAGLDKPDEGRIFIGEDEVSAFGEAQLTQLRRHTLGFVFQSFGLLPLLSAAENVELALRIAGAGMRERGERTRELLELVGLSRRANHRPYELSGGEQQRVAIARALANRPRVVIADEPTGELDSATGAQIFGLLRSVADGGATIVTATHDPFVMQHVDRVKELSDGRFVPPSERVLAPRAPDALQPRAVNPLQPPRRPTPLR
ncbi:MAG: ABC transporter ATP-binding protein [Dehalococcoidia bacterium]|nr:ABC transporter ATP-binding protein [Dehalococcoidia bacterium]